ncbi:MAG: hypothetical protein MK165_04540 [Pirellulaceae bacterium]|nr:hypothetical protein [Pirellulaceae bacterium]
MTIRRYFLEDSILAGAYPSALNNSAAIKMPYFKGSSPDEDIHTALLHKRWPTSGGPEAVAQSPAVIYPHDQRFGVLASKLFDTNKR